MPQSKREHLIDAALTLFNGYGYNATGIDRILAEAGTAKMTLYKHFKSKDDLILAALRRRDEEFRLRLSRAVESMADTPRGRLLALFDAHADWFDKENFRGCMFINAVAEFANLSEPIQAMAAENKRLIRAYISELAAEAGANDPDALAVELGLLLNGAIVSAQIDRSPESAGQARNAAAVLVEAALGG
jgi:AcrR family transcriptional regulator